MIRKAKKEEESRQTGEADKKSMMKLTIIGVLAIHLALVMCASAIRFDDGFPYDPEPDIPFPTPSPKPAPTPSCATRPCKNLSWCVEESSGPKCVCRPGYYGAFCEGVRKTELEVELGRFFGTLPDKDWDLLFGKDNYSDLFIRIVAYRSTGSPVTKETHVIDEVNKSGANGINIGRWLFFGVDKWVKIAVYAMDSDLTRSEVIYSQTFNFGQMALPGQFGDRLPANLVIRENGNYRGQVEMNIKQWYCHAWQTDDLPKCPKYL